MTKPARLYKNVPPAEWALKNLRNNQLWFSSPSGFNDPYDCQIRVERLDLSDAELVDIVKGHLNSLPPDEARKQAATLLPDGRPSPLLRQQTIDTISSVFNLMRSTMKNSRGVCCFSEKVDDLLMWGHYSDRHRGFCLEFDTSFQPFDMVHKVDYSDTIPTVDPVPLIFDGNPDTLLAMITTKAACWKYEQEWRVIHMEGNKAYSYIPAALSAVYLGLLASDELRLEAVAILKGTATRLYQMERDERAFKLTPKRLAI